MIIGVGTDIVDISRIQQSLTRYGTRFAQRILSRAEVLQYAAHRSPERYVAKRFAVKEAASKALGTGIAQGISWHDFQVNYDRLGKPSLAVTGGAALRAQALGGQHWQVSFSDERNMVVAFVILSA